MARTTFISWVDGPSFVQPDTRVTENADDDKEKSRRPRTLSKSHFPISPALNSKICLWVGDITTLDVDAVVIPTNESLTDRTGVAGKVHRKAGPDLARACHVATDSGQEGCRTGEAVYTSGFGLPARGVIHTVGPRWNAKYIDAAENALHNCYRNSMARCLEANGRVVALPCLYTRRKFYPRVHGAHVACRTLRRFLDKFDRSFDRVILVVDEVTPGQGMATSAMGSGTDVPPRPPPTAEDAAALDKAAFPFTSAVQAAAMSDMDIYRTVLPLYFPRNEMEQRAALKLLPNDTFHCNELGERIIGDRIIRIATPVPGLGAPSESTMANSALPIGKAFAKIRSDPDNIRAEVVKKKSKQSSEDVAAAYTTWLRRAKQTVLRDIMALNLIYQSGVDAMGRPIVVIIGSHLPATVVDLDRVMLYIMKVMDKVVHRPYVLVYCHSNFNARNQPSFDWIKRMYRLFDRKYKKNLAHLYVVHSNFWLRSMFWLSRMFVSAKFWKKLKYVDQVDKLFDFFDPGVLALPNQVYRADREVNKQYYAKKKLESQRRKVKKKLEGQRRKGDAGESGERRGPTEETL